jgi:hypothetical protein
MFDTVAVLGCRREKCTWCLQILCQDEQAVFALFLPPFVSFEVYITQAYILGHYTTRKRLKEFAKQGKWRPDNHC